MAKGKKCPQCNAAMYALKEEKQPSGEYRVQYVCNNCGHGETAWEK